LLLVKGNGLNVSEAAKIRMWAGVAVTTPSAMAASEASCRGGERAGASSDAGNGGKTCAISMGQHARAIATDGARQVDVLDTPIPDQPLLYFADDFVSWIATGRKTATSRVDKFKCEDGTVERPGALASGEHVLVCSTQVHDSFVCTILCTHNPFVN
jgi:hypothetical protein